jgi:predicted nucleotidyltransferase
MLSQLKGYGMVSLRNIVESKRRVICALAAQHGARNVRLFGSVARGEADSHSDVDLLVDMEPGRSLLDLGGLLMDIRDLLGVEVDVVTEKSLRPAMRDRIIREAVPL